MQASQTRWIRACALPYRCIRRMSLADGFQSIYDFKFFTIRARRPRILIAVEDTRSDNGLWGRAVSSARTTGNTCQCTQSFQTQG